MTVAEFVEKLSKLKPTDTVVIENMYGEWVDPRVVQPSSPNVAIIMDAKD